MRLFLALFLLSGNGVFAQWKDYVIGVKGDTLNCVDMQGRKQGRWVERFEQVRGEPGYEEEGIYLNDKKEGPWRLYSLMGDLGGIENYRWGNKDGKCQYFNMMGELIREESWKAVNPEQPYDTIDVPDLIDQYKSSRKVIKLEGSSLRHGTWRFYESGTGRLLKTEKYLFDKLEAPAVPADPVAGGDKAKPKPKPQAVMEWEKKYQGKKHKVREGKAGY